MVGCVEGLMFILEVAKFLSLKQNCILSFTKFTFPFLYQCHLFILIDTDVEGLFRISGNKRRQEELKSTLNKGQFVDLADRTYSQHDLTTILKQFFAELSEPLLTNSLYFCYKQVAGKTRG